MRISSLGENGLHTVIDVRDLLDCVFAGEFESDDPVDRPHCTGALVAGEGLHTGVGIAGEVLVDGVFEGGAVVDCNFGC